MIFQPVNVDLDLDINLTNSTMYAVHVNQKENNVREIHCHIKNDGEDFKIPDGTTIRIQIVKPNGNEIYSELSDFGGSLSSDRTTISFPIKNNITSISGRHIVCFELIFSNNSVENTERSYSNNFYINVHKGTIDDEKLKDSSEYKVLEEMNILSRQYMEKSAEYSNKSLGYANTSKSYMEKANTYANNAKVSETNSLTNSQNAISSASDARSYAKNASDSATQAKSSETNAKSYETNAKNYTANALSYKIEASNYAENASNYLDSIEIKTIEIKQIENDVIQMKSDVSSMKSDVTLMQEKVAQDKTDIDETIKSSLLASSEEILATVKDYFDRAQQLYNSMYIDCDGETPQQRVVTIVSIDCGTPQSRLHDTNGILFNGGTPLNRQLAS